VKKLKFIYFLEPFCLPVSLSFSRFHSFSQPTPVGAVNVDSGASAITRESNANRDRPSQQQPLRNQVNSLTSALPVHLKKPRKKKAKKIYWNQQIHEYTNPCEENVHVVNTISIPVS
jgi:hypothetical protein